jgi:Zn-dependent M28 family amino/carboxypeptidase
LSITALRRAGERAAIVAAVCTAAFASPALAAPNNNNSEKLRQAVTVDGVRSHLSSLQTIADDNGGNRFAGLPGYDASAEYVYDTLTAAGYSPEYWEFQYDATFERTPTQLSRVSPSPKTYVNAVDFRLMSGAGNSDVTGNLARPSGDVRGCFASDWAGVTPDIAIVQRGTPAGFPDNGGVCSFRIKAELAKAAGAKAVIVYNNVAGVINGTAGDPPLNYGVVGTTPELGAELLGLLATGPVVMRFKSDTTRQTLTTRNVLAETAGGDPDNVVQVGAHLDSVSQGPGINDNGSGSAAILETAVQMAKVKPRNKVRFSWWAAEESGLIGATRWVNAQTPEALDKIALYLNFDMVASPNYGLFVYDGDNSAFPVGPGAASGPPGSDVIEAMFYGFFEKYTNDAAEPTAFSGRSDYGPFIAKGIPAGGLFTGAEQPKTAAQALKWGGTAGIAYDPCYHAGCDTLANVNNHALDVNSDAIAHLTISLGQSTEAVNGIRGKGNFKRPYQGAGDGSGTGAGGGLHDHDHPEEGS